MIYKATNLSSISFATHGFFTRQGGVSEGLYASLNCGLGSGDNKTHIAENRKRIAEKLGVSASQFLSLAQVHGDKVITVSKAWDNEQRPAGDAMVTNQPGLALGILTADCVPILFADKQNKVIGAAHAGWKGAFAGIIEQTIKAMLELGATTSSIAAAVGPAIAQSSYEVDAAFYKIWTQKSADNQKYFITSKNSERFLFNLKQAVYDALLHSGINDINMLENDTYLEENDFFSFRRSTHRGEKDYGRHISTIVIIE